MTDCENEAFYGSRRLGKYPTHRRLSVAKLKRFVEINEGMTAQMIAHCLRRSWGTVSSYLAKMSKAGLIQRVESRGMKGGKSKAWRYYKIGSEQQDAREAIEIAGETLATILLNFNKGTLKSDDQKTFVKFARIRLKRVQELAWRIG